MKSPPQRPRRSRTTQLPWASRPTRKRGASGRPSEQGGSMSSIANPSLPRAFVRAAVGSPTLTHSRRPGCAASRRRYATADPSPRLGRVPILGSACGERSVPRTRKESPLPVLRGFFAGRGGRAARLAVKGLPAQQGLLPGVDGLWALDGEQRRRGSGWLVGHDLHRDRRHSGPLQADGACSATTEVKRPSGDEGTTVVDAHHD